MSGTKTKTTANSLLAAAKALPAVAGSSVEAKFKATGRMAEIEGLLKEWERGELRAPFPSQNKLREFLSAELGVEIKRCAFQNYMAQRNGKKPA